jgi:hypothetical protein
MARTRILTADALTALFLVKYRINPNNTFLGIVIAKSMINGIIVMMLLLLLFTLTTENYHSS